MRSLRQWPFWALGIIPRAIQTILLTVFVLPVFCDVKMWRAMLREVWQLPRSRTEKLSARKFEVIRGSKPALEPRQKLTGSSR